MYIYIYIYIYMCVYTFITPAHAELDANAAIALQPRLVLAVML